MFDRITSSSRVFGGTPYIKGAPVSVEFTIELVTIRAARADIIEAHPRLS